MSSMESYANIAAKNAPPPEQQVCLPVSVLFARRSHPILLRRQPLH